MNRINELFSIQIPVVQGGMVWCSGWKLASAVSEAGGLGIIGAGSMSPEILDEHIFKCKAATSKSFGVNLPLLYSHIEQQINILLKHKVKIVFTSAGNPKVWTDKLKAEGIKVVHVVSSLKFALKAEEAGCDAIVAEGFEAGGHNGRNETTTFCLIPLLKEHIKIPIIAAGGIGNGRGILAAIALGADGVQIGTLFAASLESSAHETYKHRIIDSEEGDTKLLLKSLTPVRMLKNAFSENIEDFEKKGGSLEDLKKMLGKGRSRKGIFEGNLTEGELEAGQVSCIIKEIKPASLILKDIWEDYLVQKSKLCII